MESTPRPITGYPRTWPERIPLPLAALAKGVRGLVRPSGDALLMIRPSETETVVEVRGALDVRGAQRLKLAVAIALSEGAQQVTIDLSEATRLGPPGLAALVEATQRAEGTTVQLCGLRTEVRLLLEKTGLHRVLEIRE
ncbi:STAS domain protein [compost metagenome]